MVLIMAARMIANEEGRWQKRNQLSFDAILTVKRLRPQREHNPSALSGSAQTDVCSDLYYIDRKSTRLNSSHTVISYAVFCLKKKKNKIIGLENRFEPNRKNAHLYRR